MECSIFPCFSKTTKIRSTSSTTSDETSDRTSIEKHMKLAEEMDSKTVRILLLGPGSTGKTTILKQIKKIHESDDKDELNLRKRMAKHIKSTVIDYMKILCVESVVLNAKHNENTLVHPDNEYLRQQISSLPIPCELTQDIVIKIKTLWGDKGIQNTLMKRKYFQIHENVAYFFDRIDVIAEPSYIPNFDDYIRFRQKSTGLQQTTMSIDIDNMGPHIFEFTDVAGQRSERRKWMGFISEDVDAVIYVVGISDYDLTLFEDNKTNRLTDCIELFKKVMIRGNFFKKKSVMLFFNKYDLFKEKIKNTPITVAFDDFPVTGMNPNDENDVLRFVSKKFLKVLSDANVALFAPLHFMKTTALDTGNIEKIFMQMGVDLVKRNMNTSLLI